MSLADSKRKGKLWNPGLIESVIMITLMLRSVRLRAITIPILSFVYANKSAEHSRC